MLTFLAYHLIPKWRKRTLSNLALATDLHLSNDEIVKTAKKSFRNLVTIALEYPKFALAKKFKWARCVNPERAEDIIKSGQGIIFYCGHIANWEVLFLEGTMRMPGVAIGRPIKYKRLYNIITRMREKHGGTMITPKNALKEGLRGLKAGKFLGIVGDQGMPESAFSSLFLGRRAYTTTAPALLAYKTGCPIMVAITKRVGRKYEIHYSDPLYADKSRPIEEESERLMREALALFEQGVKERPHEWLWQHNRFKQETPANVYYRFRHESILILLGEDKEILKTFREIYPRAFISVYSETPLPEDDYEVVEKPLLDDYRFKLVFNLMDHPKAKRHYKRLSAFEVLSPRDLKKIAHLDTDDTETLLRGAICRK